MIINITLLNFDSDLLNLFCPFLTFIQKYRAQLGKREFFIVFYKCINYILLLAVIILL